MYSVKNIISKSALLVILIFYAANAQSYSEREKSHYYDRIVKDKYMEVLCFQPSSDLSYEWRLALYYSIKSFNDQVGWYTKVNFRYKAASYRDGYDPCSYTVSVNSKDDRYNSARATTYTNRWRASRNYPASKITINLDKVGEYPRRKDKQYVMMHEMMHVIGIEHTGIYSRYNEVVPGSQNDSEPYNSIVRPGFASESDPYNEYYSNPTTLTYYDKQTIRHMYGWW